MPTRGTDRRKAGTGRRRTLLVKLRIGSLTTRLSSTVSKADSSEDDSTPVATPTPAPRTSRDLEAQQNTSCDHTAEPDGLVDRSCFTPGKTNLLNSISTAIFATSASTTDLNEFFSNLPDEHIFEAIEFMKFLHARELEKQIHQNMTLPPNTASSLMQPPLAATRTLLLATATQIIELAQKNDSTKGQHKPYPELINGQQKWYTCATCECYISNVRFACLSHPTQNWCSKECFTTRKGHEDCHFRAMDIKHVARTTLPELVDGKEIWYDCDECDKDIEGVRWTCLECDKEDYCSWECLKRSGGGRCGHEFGEVEIKHAGGQDVKYLQRDE